MPTIPELEFIRSLVGDISAVMYAHFATDFLFFNATLEGQGDVQAWATSYWDWFNDYNRLWNDLDVAMDSYPGIRIC